MNTIINKKKFALIFLVVLLPLLVGCFPFFKNESPIITSTPITSATVNDLYTYDVEASDPDGDILTYSLNIKPEGMSINSSTGLINWTPTTEGDYDVFINVSDGVYDVTQSFIIVVVIEEEPGFTPTPGPTPTPPTPPTPPVKPEWLGDPKYSPDIIFTLEQTNVHFNILVNKKKDELASESPVKLLRKDENADWLLLDEMFDDGDLNNHGDEIKGDRIYSNIIEFYEENVTVIPLKIVVTTSDNQQYIVEFNLSVIVDISEEYYQGSIEVFDLSEQKLNEIMKEPPADVETCLTILGDFLTGQTSVESYEVQGNTIRIIFDSGLFSTITLREEGSIIDSGGNLSKSKNSSFVDSFNKRTKEKNIPLQEQTTGKNVIVFEPNEEDNYFIKSGENEDIDYIGNRSIFIWDPFHTWHTDLGYNNIESFSNIFNDSGQLFSVVTYEDHMADVDSLEEITDYGIVIFSTHGSGYSIVTGEVANDAKKYNDEVQNSEMWISQDMVVSEKEGIFTVTKWLESRWSVSTFWFDKKLSNDFPNSIIFNKSCSNGNLGFFEVFKKKGASTYFGNDNTSTVSFGTRKVEETLQGLVDGQTTGEAYIEESETVWHWDKIFSFPYTTTNTWRMFCKDDKDNIKIPETIPFSNGGFEDDFTNWEKEGDGRIIYALSFLEPTEGEKMGIISTGLGYTVKYGSLSQTFKVGDNDTNLRFDWNYISEEFLEWIGSQFQDPFKVTLTKVDDSSTTTLLYKTVDGIAADFGATYENGGDLIYVSPDIVFDRGDVWMTDWQNSTYDISAFQGNDVTITFEAEDLGDEIYDTAILLDDIKVY